MLDRQGIIAEKTRVTAQHVGPGVEQLLRATFGKNTHNELAVGKGTIIEQGGKPDVNNSKVVIVDLDAQQPDDVVALHRLANRLNGSPPVVAVTQGFDQTIARKLLQI